MTARPGNCYEDALTAILDGTYDVDGCVTYLCHGFPLLTKPDHGYPAGTMYGHAWLEVDDPNGNTFCINILGCHLVPKDLYYTLGRIDPKHVTRYTRDEAIEAAGADGTNGPWVEGPPAAVYRNA